METKKIAKAPKLGPALVNQTITYRNPWIPEPPKNYCRKISKKTLEREGYPVTNMFEICYDDRIYILHREWNILHISERSMTHGDTETGVTLTVPFYPESGYFGDVYGMDRWGNPLSIFMVWKLRWIFRKDLKWK